MRTQSQAPGGLPRTRRRPVGRSDGGFLLALVCVAIAMALWIMLATLVGSDDDAA